jgi:hypothetical protein
VDITNDTTEIQRIMRLLQTTIYQETGERKAGGGRLEGIGGREAERET